MEKEKDDDTKETKEAIVGVPEGTLEKMIDRLPQGVQERAAQLAKDFETPYIEVPDKVMVLDISSSALTRIDGIPGVFDVEFGDERLKDTGLKERREMTKQGLVKRYRFPVKINVLPTTEHRYEFNIVSSDEWNKFAQGKESSGLTDAQVVASQMSRAGGAT